MADRLRIVNLQWPRPPSVLVDFSPTNSSGLLRDSFAIKYADPAVSVAAGVSRWAGERIVNERRSNATVSFTILALGLTGPGVLSLVQNVLEQVLGANTPDLAIEWRPDGASVSIYYRLRGPATFGLSYSWAKFTSANYLPVDIAFPVAPTGEGGPYDIFDDFSTDTIAIGDWVKDRGTTSLSVLQSRLAASVASGGSAVQYRHTRGYAYGDVELSMTSIAPASSTGYVARLCLAMDTAGAETYIALEQNATNVSLVKLVGGTRTQLATAAYTFGSGTTWYWLLRREGNVIYWRIDSSLSYADYTIEPNAYTLAGADLRLACAGHVGISINDAVGGSSYDNFSCRPFTYRAIQTPERIALKGPIAGEAPAMADIEVTPVVGASTSPALFGLVAFGERPQIHNMLTGGNLTNIRSNASATYGWTASAVSGISAAATSYARASTSSGFVKYGGSILSVVLPATASSGASYQLNRRFKRGRHYVGLYWTQVVGGVTSIAMQAKLGVSGDLAVSSYATFASNTLGQIRAVVWQPTADRDNAYFSVQQSTAVAGTIEADGVLVAEVPTVTLAAAVLAAGTTIQVYFTPSEIPYLNPDGTISQPFAILVDSELMTVTAISGTTWTVQRGAEATIANNHAQDAFVAVLPVARPQFEGKGGLPIFGVHEAEDYAFDRIAVTTGSSTDYRNGTYITNSIFQWYVDPSTALPDDFTQGDVLVELWGRFAFDPALTGGLITTSAEPSEQYDPTAAASSIAGQKRYTFEYGTVGQTIVAPTGTGGTVVPQFIKLGQIAMTVDRARPQRWRVTCQYGSLGGATPRCDYLIAIPERMRLATSTGKSTQDTTYASFVPNLVSANAVTKILKADGSAALRQPRLGAARQPDPFPDTGLGRTIDLPNTDCDVLVKLSNLVPNDPGSQTMEMFTAQPYWNATVHVAVTPRYVGVRGA
jgi:hypothetical protein